MSKLVQLYVHNCELLLGMQFNCYNPIFNNSDVYWPPISQDFDLQLSWIFTSLCLYFPGPIAVCFPGLDYITNCYAL